MMPLKFSHDQWQGNQWASIDIDPVDIELAQKILSYLSNVYDFKMPTLHLTLDGFYADCKILGTDTKINVDNWTASIAFKNEEVRDNVLEKLKSLPVDFFD